MNLTVSNAQPVVVARGLTRAFGDFVAVDGIDVTVRPREVFGLLGANGAGKTTTIRMLCGTLPPSAGQVEVGAVDMVRDPRRARGRIGYVTQRFTLYGDLTTMENLKLQAGLYGLTGSRRRERLSWALAHLGLQRWAQKMARNLPLGIQRRLALAAALLHEPRVLFLDEPTSGVDPAARQRFWELIYDLAEGGMGILVTTHYMDEALFCDRLCLMHAGKVVAEGTPAALLARPLVAPLLELGSPDCGRCAQLIAGWPEVREVVPHAGRLRIRLQPGAASDVLMERMRTVTQRNGVEITRLQPAEPELEDVFVAVLEATQEGGG